MKAKSNQSYTRFSYSSVEKSDPMHRPSTPSRSSETGVPISLHRGVAEFAFTRHLNAQRWLDMGCGEGKLISLLRDIINPKEMYGVDENGKLLQKLPTDVKAVKCDLNWAKLPFPDAYFDLVTATEVIEHLSNTDNLAQESFRLLHTGGYFLVTTPNLASWANRLLLLLGYQLMNTEPSARYSVGLPSRNKLRTTYSGHLNLFTLRSLVEFLLLHGFKVVATTGIPIEFKARFMTTLDSAFARLSPSLATALLVMAQKPP